MKIRVEDRAPGASAGRTTYLEERTRRVLGRMSDRLTSIEIDLGVGEGDHCLVAMCAQLAHGRVLEVSVQRRLLPDALADAFDALVTRIALGEASLIYGDEDIGSVHGPARRPSRRLAARV